MRLTLSRRTKYQNGFVAGAMGQQGSEELIVQILDELEIIVTFGSWHPDNNAVQFTRSEFLAELHD
jgi:hypothetical protein